MKFSIVVAALMVTASASRLGFEDRGSGDPIAICNGANAGACTEADVVV